MSRPLARLAPAALAAASLLLGGGCRARGDRPGMIFMPGMHDSVPFDAYDANPALAGGKTQILPPDGTVPVGRLPFAYGTGPEEAARAGRELANPLPATEANLARGKAVYETICVVCHGPKGEGDGSVIGAGRFPNPPSLLGARAKGMPDGQMVHVVSRGQGIMPSHAAQVLPDDRWRVVMHIRGLQGKPPAVVAEASSPANRAAVPGSAPVVPSAASSASGSAPAATLAPAPVDGATTAKGEPR